ncbi:hypothetical protein TNCV_1590511 [Trichonephila clavipes]|nr:hypothetical protein TNCV_1590511 [Trichonephila clavipes]
MGIGDGPRTFETLSSDQDNTEADTISKPLHHTNGRTLSLDRLNMHQPPLHGGVHWHQDSNLLHVDHEFVTITTRLPHPEI